MDWLLSLEPDIVILAIGGNDGLRGIDPRVTQENLAADHGAPAGGGGHGRAGGHGDGAEHGRGVHRRVPCDLPSGELKQYGAILIPFMLEGVAADPALNQPDFIHPTADGYAVVVETIYPYIVEALGQLQ